MPLVAVMVAGKPNVFVKTNVAGALTPAARARTIYPPAVSFAVKNGAVATPLALVWVTTVRTSPEKMPVGPLIGAVNVTVMFGSR